MSDITKRAMSASLKKLLLQKPLKDITVGDITDDCGVNRQTFYYHFQDLADLIEWTCLEDSDVVLKGKKDYDTWQEGFLEIFNLMLQDKAFINNIYHSVSLETLEDYLYKITYPLLKDVVDEVAKGMEVREEDKKFIADFYKFAFVGVVLNWIKGGMKEKPEIIVGRISTLISGTIQRALENYR
jgi:probable dihydroxyacetone kinase regulator